MFKRIGMAAAFVAVSAPAYACVCPLLKSDAETQEYKRNYANRSVRLKLTSFQLRMAPNADPRAEAMAEVVEQPKTGARYPSRVVVESDGGDETANCGKASLLFIAASTQRWIRAQITKSRGGHYEIGGCSPMDIEPWQGAAAPPSPHN